MKAIVQKIADGQLQELKHAIKQTVEKFLELLRKQTATHGGLDIGALAKTYADASKHTKRLLRKD